MQYEPTAPAPRCETHEGAHPVYEGRCYAFGTQVERPARFGPRTVICQECGAEQDVLRLPRGRVMLLTSGTSERHHHPPREAPRVEIDEDRRAATATAEHRAPTQPVEGMSPARRDEGSPLGGVPTVT